MNGALISILALGFLLGIKHAIEPDHIIAVSTIARETKTIKKSILAGVYWGIGHTSTLFIVGMFLIIAKNSITDKVAMSLEFAVGIMLVYLGLTSILSVLKRESNVQYHMEQGHVHKGKLPHLKSFLIGFVHGLAGSAAMVLLAMSTVSSVWQGALYILIFGGGTVVGMLCFSTVIGIPFILSSEKKLNKYLSHLSGIVSTLFGIYYMYELGIHKGLFALWFL